MENRQIGSLIRRRRKEQGMTQKDLALWLNVTDKAISKWERDLSLPDVSLLLPLAEALGISVTELLRGSPHPDAPPPDPAGELLSYSRRTAPQRQERLRLLLCAGLTGALALAALVCWICDTALNQRLTWSRIVDLSLALAWVTLLPLLAARRRALPLTLAVLSASILPYLYLLGWLLEDPRVFRLGLPIAPVSAGFLWLLWAAVRKLRQRPWLAGGAALVLTAALSFYINVVVRILTGSGTLLGDSLFSLLLAAACAAADRLSRRAPEDDAS